MFAIKKMRELAGLSQRDVAEDLDISIRRYGNWEREDREINLRDAIRLADLFHCTLDDLAGREWPAGDSTITAEERDLVDSYRKSDDRGKGNILDTAHREKSASQPNVVHVGVNA